MLRNLERRDAPQARPARPVKRPQIKQPAAKQPAAKPRPRHKARKGLVRPPAAVGWRTTDAGEIALRRWRDSYQSGALRALGDRHPIYSTFRGRSGPHGP